MTHTPGPWKRSDYLELSVLASTGRQAARIFTENHGIALTYGASKEDYANAQLIAAAPELLKALENIMLWASESGIGLSQWHTSLVEPLSAANKAIAHATKEE